MRLGLFGQFGTGNSGNDGSLEAMIRLLRKHRPDAELVCICPNPAQVTADFGIEAISSGRTDPQGRHPTGAIARAIGRMRNLVYPFAAAGLLDALIVPGTGFLDDFQEAPFGWPLMIMRWSLAARFRGAKLAFVSIGAGPIRHAMSRRFMVAAARLCHYRSYRDQISKDFMLSLGCGSEADRVYPDLAFSLTAPNGRAPRDERVTVGVGVMAYAGWVRQHADGEAIYERYTSGIVAFIAWLLRQGHDVRLLTGDKQDQQAVSDVLERLKVDMPPDISAIVTLQPTRTLQELMEQIAMTDIVVATRFHNVVGALKMARPVVSLGYARKNEVLLEDMGLHGMSQPVEDLDLDLLKTQFTRALRDRAAISDQIKGCTALYASRLAEQERALLRVLSPRRSGERSGDTQPSGFPT